jgi:hypothetical protein
MVGYGDVLAPASRLRQECPEVLTGENYFAIVGFTQPACITLCDGRKLK